MGFVYSREPVDSQTLQLEVKRYTFNNFKGIYSFQMSPGNTENTKLQAVSSKIFEFFKYTINSVYFFPLNVDTLHFL